MCQKPSNIFEEKRPWLLSLKYLLNSEEQSTPGVSKPLAVASMAKRLTWEPPAQHVKIWNAMIRNFRIKLFIQLNLSYIPCKAAVIISEKLGVAFMEEMLVCLSRSEIPFTCEYALATAIFRQGNMKPADTGEKIDELVGGLLCHASHKHNGPQFKSHKWTPVHPGEPATNPTFEENPPQVG